MVGNLHITIWGVPHPRRAASPEAAPAASGPAGGAEKIGVITRVNTLRNLFDEIDQCHCHLLPIPYLFVILVSRDCVTVPAVQAMCNRPRRCVSVQGDVPAFKAMCQHSGRCDGVLRQASSAGQVLHASSTMSQMISSTQQNVRSCVSACEVTPLCAPVKSPLGVCLRRCV